MSDWLGEERDGRFVRRMTVAGVREPPGADHVEVMFNESARFYRLLRASPSFDEDLRLLKKAGPAGRPVEVTLASLESDVIKRVEGGDCPFSTAPSTTPR